MSKLALFLALSLAANAAFFITFFVRSAAPPAATVETKPAATVAKAGPSLPVSSPIAATLTSGDLGQLKAAGIPDEVARSILFGRAHSRLQARQRALFQPLTPNSRYWSNPNYASTWTKERRLEMAKAQREFEAAMRELGDGSPFRNPFETETEFSYLPAAKREQLRRIRQDYGEMRNEFNETDGIQLASDRLKVKMLQEEQERDIAAALSPQELEEYLLRTSPTAQSVRRNYGDAIQSEDDYKKVYALQKAFDEQYPNRDRINRSETPSPALKARQEAERRLQEDILAVVGESNFAAAQRMADQEFKALTALEKRLNLPTGTADQLYASRDAYALQSRQISENPSLSNQERVAQLTSLAGQATANLRATLGKEGAEAYIQQASWINMLSLGTAFSTNPKDSPGTRLNLGRTIYQVPTRNNVAPAGQTGTR